MPVTRISAKDVPHTRGEKSELLKMTIVWSQVLDELSKGFNVNEAAEITFDDETKHIMKDYKNVEECLYELIGHEIKRRNLAGVVVKLRGKRVFIQSKYVSY
jgi:hypothetical protein